MKNINTMKELSKAVLALVFLLLSTLCTVAQNVSINADGSAPDPSAMLDVSDTTKGLLIPRLTLVQRNALVSPAPSLLIYQTDNTPGYYYNSNTSASPVWEQLVTENNLGDPVSINDADNNTKIQVEETTNEDIIRMDNAGMETFTFQRGKVSFLNSGNTVAVGDGAGANDDFSANNNTAIGSNALNANIVGSDNVALGKDALLLANSSSRNTAIGGSSMSSTVSSAFDNVGIGFQSLLSLTGGDANVSVGTYSLASVANGSANTALGYNAGNSNNGNNNVFLGMSAGRLNTGSGNVFIGQGAAENETSSNKLFIENSNSATPLIYGDFDDDSVKIYGQLSVGNAYTFPNSIPVSGNVLTHDGTGLVWGSPATDGNGIYSGSSSLSGKTTVAQGSDTLAFTSNSVNGFNVDSTTFSVDAANNRVGIGTSTPTSLLNVDGGEIVMTNSPNGIYTTDRASIGLGTAQLEYNSTATPANAADFQIEFNPANNNGSGTSTHAGIGFHKEAGSDDSYINFTTKADGGVFTEYMRIDEIGNVGIGTTNPNFTLDVEGSASINELNINSAYTFPTDAPTNGEVLKYNGTDLIWDASSSSPWTISGSDITRSTGSVAIGTATVNTNTKFEVENTTNTIGAFIDNRYSGGSIHTAFRVNATGTSTQAKTGMALFAQNTGNVALKGMDITLDKNSGTGSATALDINFTGTGTGNRFGILMSGDDRSRFEGALSLGNAGFVTGYDLTLSNKAQFGENGADGELRLYSEQGGTDFNVDLKPNPAMTADVDFVFPPAPGTTGDVLTLDASGNTLWQAAVVDNDWVVSGGVVYNNTNRFAVGTVSPPAAYLGEFEVAAAGTQTVGLSIDNDYNGAAQTWGLITDISVNGTGQKYGVFNTVTSNVAQPTANSIFGVQNTMNGAAAEKVYGVNNLINGSGTAEKYGSYNNVLSSGTQSGSTYGTYNQMAASSTEAVFGTYNNFLGTGTGRKTGVFNEIVAPTGTANQIAGTDNNISNQGSSDSYGTHTTITSDGTGKKYGSFNDITVDALSPSDAFGMRSDISANGSGNTYGIYIDYNATGSGNNFGFYSTGEDFNYFSGNVGIGTPSPNRPLTVQSSGTSYGIEHTNGTISIQSYTDNVNGFGAIGTVSNNPFYLYMNDGNPLVTLTSTSTVAIGNNHTTATATLDVNGNLEIDGTAATAGTDAFYFGDRTTDGSWRIRRDGNDLSFERLEGGTWNFKMKINP